MWSVPKYKIICEEGIKQNAILTVFLYPNYKGLTLQVPHHLSYQGDCKLVL